MYDHRNLYFTSSSEKRKAQEYPLDELVDAYIEEQLINNSQKDNILPRLYNNYTFIHLYNEEYNKNILYIKGDRYGADLVDLFKFYMNNASIYLYIIITIYNKLSESESHILDIRDNFYCPTYNTNTASFITSSSYIHNMKISEENIYEKINDIKNEKELSMQLNFSFQPLNSCA